MEGFREFLAEAKDLIPTLKSAVENAKSFMDVGKELKKLKIKYDFSTEMMPIYWIKSGSDKYAILNKKYVDNADVYVGDIGIGKM